MSILVFDVDRSLASIGPAGLVNSSFGIEPLTVTDGLATVLTVLKQLTSSTTKTTPHPVLGVPVAETVYTLSPAAVKIGLNCIAIDTVSHLQRQDLRKLEASHPTGQMEISDWGKIERSYGLFADMLNRLPLPVIMNCHISYDKDETGVFHYGPQLKGKAGDFIRGYFDVVMYTKVSRKKDNTLDYSWIVHPDNTKKAKDRLNALPALMPQDYGVIFKAYADAGYPNPKILVIGDSGEGKTRALLTAASYFSGVKNNAVNFSGILPS